MAVLAILPAYLLAYNLPPSSTFLNQALAFAGFGIWAVALGSKEIAEKSRSPIQPQVVALLIAAVASLASMGWASVPASLALSATVSMASAALVSMIAARLRADRRAAAFASFCCALAFAGFLSCLIGLIQVFAPHWADGDFIARTYIEGRAVGNLRQPNHLSSLLMWAIVAVLWLGEAKVIRRAASTGLALLFLFVVVLTASRTGALSTVLLLAWGVSDRRLSRSARIFLIASPLIYGVFWYGTGLWADATHHVFGGETRFNTQGDVSSSRIGIWSNTLALIRMHPWAGVGFGEFNFAWTLTPFPNRPVAFFDHTHDLVLQFLVELGIPLGLLVLGLLLRALVQAFRAALRPAAADAPAGEPVLRMSAFMMVLLILVHSLLEYPLWYAYFLLPAAFAFGICLGAPAPSGLEAAPRPRLNALAVGAILLLFGGLLSVLDYARVVVIFAPGEGAPPLAERIVDGRKSVFFSHHADYAAATTSEHPADVLPAFRDAPHYLLDARLLQAWAVALDQAGDTDRARYLAARLREFRNEQSAAFFAPCEAPPEPGAVRPFQCTPPERSYRYEDFR